MLLKHLAQKALRCGEKLPCSTYSIKAMCRSDTSIMKKYICILASAALLAACEQKTETTEPVATPAPTSPPAATAVTSPATTTESSDATTESPGATTESPAGTTDVPAETTESPGESPP